MPRSIVQNTGMPAGDLVFPGSRANDRWRAAVAVPVIIALSLAAWGGLIHLGGLLQDALR